MIIIPSRGRPQLLKRFMKAYVATEATCPVVVWVDCDDDCFEEYQSLVFMDIWPSTWLLKSGPRMKCPQAFAWLFEAFPKEPWYALFGDDVEPQTKHWDRLLEEACGTRKVSYGTDLHTWPRAPHPFIGGDLVRAVGWLAFPNVLHWYQDTAYEWLAKVTDRLVPMEHVVTAHHNEAFDPTIYDQTYKDRWLDLTTGVHKTCDDDFRVWVQWHESGEAFRAAERIKKLCPI